MPERLPRVRMPAVRVWKDLGAKALSGPGRTGRTEGPHLPGYIAPVIQAF
jgi:hypothetical protein